MISDQRNDLAYLFENPGDQVQFRYHPLEMLADIQADQLATYDALRRIVTHLEQLHYYVPDFPLRKKVIRH